MHKTEICGGFLVGFISLDECDAVVARLETDTDYLEMRRRRKFYEKLIEIKFRTVVLH